MTRARGSARSPRRALAGAALLLLAAGCGGEGVAERFQPLAVGRPAPRYAARTLGGDSARVAPGQPVTLVNVWATWCGPCKKEFPELQRLYETYGDRGLRILAVSVDRGGDDAVTEFVASQGATFTIARDPEGRVQDIFQTIGVPETYLVGADGTLLWRRVGELHPNDTSLSAALERALAD